MSRVFGLVLAFGAMIGSAQAALLVGYDYSIDGSKDHTFLEPGMNAAESGGSFSQSTAQGNLANAAVAAGASSASRGESFYISTAASSVVTLSSITFDARRVAGTGTGALRAVLASIALNLGTPTGDGLDANPPDQGFVAGSTISPSSYTLSSNFSSNLTNSFQTFTLTFNTPLSFDSANVLRSTITLAGAANAGGGQTLYQLDNVQFFGTVVPEPGSMAVFGLLGAGVVVRRMRRK